MTIKSKIQIVELLFKTLDGEEVTEAHIDQVLAALVQSPVKRANYKKKMIEKYGEDVFTKRAKRLADAVKQKGDEWRKERARKAGSTKG